MMSPMALSRTINRLAKRGDATGAVAIGEVATGGNDSVIFIAVPTFIAAPTAICAASGSLRPQARALTNDVSGRMIFGIAHDDDATSAGFDLVTLGYAFGRVVGSLDMKIRADFADDGTHIFF